jgi:MATE family multidrug resistance protein
MRPGIGTLLLLAWPVVVSRSTQTIVGLADALMVAHLGASALAATTTGAMNTFVLLILPMGVTFIVQSFSSQLFGQGDALGARRYALYGLMIAFATQLFALATLPAIGPALSVFGYDTAVRTDMHAYLLGRLPSAGAAIGLEALGAYYGGVGRTWVPMIANVVAMVLNIALNFILIDGRLGAPAFGVSGAAIASSIATGIAFFGLLAYFVSQGQFSRPRYRELGRTLWFGIPSGLNWFFEFLAFMFFVNVVVVGLGTEPLAALMAVLQINSVSFMPAFGVASAGAILVGQAIGKERKEDVPRLVRMTFFTNAIWQAVVGVAYVAIPTLLMAPFATGAPQLIEIGARMLALSAGWQLFDSAATALAETLRAAGDTLVPLLVRLAIAWGLFVPGSWIAVHVLDGGDTAAIGFLIAYLALLALALFIRFQTGAWRKIKLTEPTV